MLISEREVLYLIGVFLVLLSCTNPQRLAEHAAYFRRHGLFISVDALKPEKGNTALYVVRELKFGLVLQVTPLLSADGPAPRTGRAASKGHLHGTLERRVLEPVKALGYQILGIVSDDERAMILAAAHVFPDVRHGPAAGHFQTCQSHCLREAATPKVALRGRAARSRGWAIADADQTFKKALKQAVRGPFYATCRALSHLAPEHPCHAVLNTYAELMAPRTATFRNTLTEGSKPP